MPKQSQLGTITQAREGMRVRDVDGHEVGWVVYVQIGDPEAATAPGAEAASTDALQGYVDIGQAEPDVAEPLRSQLLRQGFVKVVGSGLTDSDRYVRADHVERVDGDVVVIHVPGAGLPREL